MYCLIKKVEQKAKERYCKIQREGSEKERLTERNKLGNWNKKHSITVIQFKQTERNGKKEIEKLKDRKTETEG